jgi:hypothetical protein
MRFRIVRTHRRGIPLPRQELVRERGVTGELVTAQAADDAFKSTVIVARLHDAAGGKPTIELLPSLYQATLRILAPRGMLITGYERVRERERVVVEYVQGWWARPP